MTREGDIGRRRVPKTAKHRLRDCGTHLRFLRDAYQQATSGDPDRYKQVAAELRVLVCETRLNKPLLLNLMDEFGFECAVDRPADGPPTIRGISTVQSAEALTARSEELRAAMAAGDKKKLEEIKRFEKIDHPDSLPLRDFVDRGLAFFTAPKQFSFRDVTLAVAQQMGSSHEDEAIDEDLARSLSVTVTGIRNSPAPHEVLSIPVYSVLTLAEWVIPCGEAFLEAAQQQLDPTAAPPDS